MAFLMDVGELHPQNQRIATNNKRMARWAIGLAILRSKQNHY